MAKAKRSKRAEAAPVVERATEPVMDNAGNGDESPAVAAASDVGEASASPEDLPVVDAEVVDSRVPNEVADLRAVDEAPPAAKPASNTIPIASTAVVNVDPPTASVALVVATPRPTARSGTALDHLVVLLATPLLMCLAALSLPGSWLRRGGRPRV